LKYTNDLVGENKEEEKERERERRGGGEGREKHKLCGIMYQEDLKV